MKNIKKISKHLKRIANKIYQASEKEDEALITELCQDLTIEEMLLIDEYIMRTKNLTK